MKQPDAFQPPGWKAWILATRPKTLSAAIVPMVVGTCLAAPYTQELRWSLTFYALVSAALIQIGTNLINDALDSKQGRDTSDRLGPQRATASGWLAESQVLMMGFVCLLAALVIGAPLMLAGGFPLTLVIAISALMGYLYTGGPMPLAYHGLGDLFVFLFFGVVATCSLFFVQTGQLSWEPLLAGCQIGMTATVMIAINNLRDYDEDRSTGKNTLAVRLGKRAVRLEITFLLFAPYVLGMLWGSRLALLPLATLPLAWFIAQEIWSHEPSKQYNQFLAHSSLFHLLFGVCLAAGAWTS